MNLLYSRFRHGSEAAVDHEVGAVDVTGRVRSEEGHHASGKMRASQKDKGKSER